MASYFHLTLDTLAPSGLAVTLNDGALYTTQRSVTLKTTVSDEAATGYQMKIWGIADAAEEGSAAWETYTEERTVMLSEEDGLKTVYVAVRDDVGNECSAVSATITLDTVVPVVSVTGPDRSTLSKVSGYDSATVSFTCDTQFEEYKVCVVPAIGSLESAGTVIPTDAGSTNMSGAEGSYAANTNISATIKGADLQTVSPSDGEKIIKIFVRTAAGTWSVA